MSISVIVSNFNGEKYLPKLIETLKDQQGVQFEIIIVDRNSTDGSSEILNCHPEILVVSEPPQSGLVSGYAKGAEVARYEHLFFCNEDMWFEKDCLSRLLALIDLENRVCAVDPWQWRFNQEELIHANVRFRISSFDLNSPYPFRSTDYLVQATDNEQTAFCCAGAFLIHRKAYEQVGGWDRSFFLDNEDTDLFLRLWQLDWKAVTCPNAKVYHDVGGSNKKVLSTQETVGEKRYIARYANKALIGVKTFSFYLLPLIGVAHGIRFINNLVKCRFKWAYWDLKSVVNMIKRLPGNLAYRFKHKKLNKVKPGQDFFKFPIFQIKK